MNIALPFQAKCENRCEVTSGPNPDGFIAPILPENWSMHSFHFFVDWRQNPPLINTIFWKTYLVQFGPGESPENSTCDQICAAFSQSGYVQEFRTLRNFCTKYSTGICAIFLPEINASLMRDNSPVWMIRENSTTVETITYAALKCEIQERSGGAVQVGSKGLTYGTSAIECALSRTDAAYPGDVDSIIIDKNLEMKAIIEYKKHNLSTPISDELALKYFDNGKDRRKYQRLNSLVSYFRQANPTLPFVIFYYATKFPSYRIQVNTNPFYATLNFSNDSGDCSLPDAQSALRALMV